MGSYLDNLAARALGRLEVVRPRQPSRFEPVTAADVRQLDPLEIVETVPADDPEHPEPAAPPMKTVTSEPPASRESIAREDGGVATPIEYPRSRSHDVMPARIAESFEASPVPAVDRGVPHPAPEVSAAPIPERATARPASEVRQVATLRLTPTQRTRTAAWDNETLDAASWGNEALDPADQEQQAREAPPAETTFPDFGVPVVVRPFDTTLDEPTVAQIAITREDIEAGLQEARIASSAPSITVSIGRIEVRAVRPEPPRAPSRPPRPQPRMTLDTFLSRQGPGR